MSTVSFLIKVGLKNQVLLLRILGPNNGPGSTHLWSWSWSISIDWLLTSPAPFVMVSLHGRINWHSCVRNTIDILSVTAVNNTSIVVENSRANIVLCIYRINCGNWKGIQRSQISRSGGCSDWRLFPSGSRQACEMFWEVPLQSYTSAGVRGQSHRGKFLQRHHVIMSFARHVMCVYKRNFSDPRDPNKLQLPDHNFLSLAKLSWHRLWSSYSIVITETLFYLIVRVFPGNASKTGINTRLNGR